MKTFRKRSNRAFTLVELLVVVGIIAILSAVSFSAIMAALSRAKTAKCSSNLHNIGIALLAFAADNEGNFPTAGGTLHANDTSPDPNTGQYAWTVQLEPYLEGKSTTIYQCPDSSKIIPENAIYSYFLGSHAAFAATHSFSPVNLAKANSPTQLILGGDIGYKGVLDTNDADKDDYTQDPAFNGNGTSQIHGGTVNVLFADGHIENLRKFDKNSMATRYDGPGFDYLDNH